MPKMHMTNDRIEEKVVILSCLTFLKPSSLQPAQLMMLKSLKSPIYLTFVQSLPIGQSVTMLRMHSLLIRVLILRS